MCNAILFKKKKIGYLKQILNKVSYDKKQKL